MGSSSADILYLGDTALDGAAGYLAGLMKQWNWSFEYVPSHLPFESAEAQLHHRLFIVSDYPSEMLGADAQHAIVRAVERGAGLLMIGGWESFCGMGGDWAGTPLGDILPVHIATTDDRVNCDQPALLRKAQDHPITENLPWHDRPPTVGGFNRLAPKPDATVLLEVERFRARISATRYIFDPVGRHPMLVVGQQGAGRTVALATDLAPHWVGGLVDWGADRFMTQKLESGGIEVGNLYAQFVRQLLAWTGTFE